MANRRYDPVSYRPFRAQPVLAEGLLAVARPGGEFLERVSAGLFRLADAAGQRADAQAERQGALDGQRAAVAGRPSAEFAENGAGAAVSGGDHRQIAASILRKEEGFRESPYWDVTAYRTGYGSDTITTADGKKLKVEKGMKVSREDAERDLARRIGEFESRAAGQTGSENWNRLPAAVRGALLSVTYNYGSLPKSVADAVRGGDRAAIANAVGGLSANKARRGREASIIRGSATPSATASGPAGGGATFTGGTFRPSGRDTVYGRAYDEAGAKTYVQMLDTEIRSTQSQLFDRHRDDPVALEAALRDNRTDMLDRHVFPEIAADFEVGYGRMAEQYLAGARDNQAKRIEEQGRADWVERGSALSTDIQQRLANGDPDSPGAADALASAQAAVDNYYDDAADRGFMSPSAAAEAKIKHRNGTAVAFYARQAEKRDADGVAAMRKEMHENMAAGGVDGLDGDGWVNLDAALRKLEDAKRVEQKQLVGALRTQGDQFTSRVAAGFQLDETAFNDFVLQAGDSPAAQAVVQETRDKLSIASVIRDLPLAEAESHVAALRKGLGDNPSDEQLRTYDYAQKFLASKAKLLADDPVAFVQNNNPEVAAAWEAATGGEPDAYSHALALTAAAQERLGIAPTKLLPKAMANSISGRVTDAAEKEADRIAALTGPIFATPDPEQQAKVFDQLVGAGVPEIAEGGINAMARGDTEASRRLLQAALIDPETLPGKVAETKAKIDEAIQAQIMEPGQIGDVYYGLSGGAVENYTAAARDRKLITRAVQMRLRAGEDLDSAVQRVARDLYGDVVAVSETGDVNAQLLLPAGLDAAPVLAGLPSVLPRVRAALEDTTRADAGAVGPGGLVVHNRVMSNHIGNILSEGYFRNAGDGFVFIDPYSGLAVGDKDGAPIVFERGEVEAAGKAALENEPLLGRRPKYNRTPWK